MLKIFIPALALLLLISCDETPNGGPCAYDIDTVQATVFRIDTTSPEYPDLWVSIPSKLMGTDSMRYAALSDSSLTREEIMQRGYAIGTTFRVERQFRTSGHCTPEIFILR